MYQRFQNTLEDERKALYGRVRNAETQVAALAEQLRPQPGSKEEPELSELRNRDALTAQALLDLAEHLVAADSPVLQETEAKLRATEEQIDALAREEERGLAVERLRDELAAAQREHASLAQREPELEKRLAQAEASLTISTPYAALHARARRAVSMPPPLYKSMATAPPSAASLTISEYKSERTPSFTCRNVFAPARNFMPISSDSKKPLPRTMRQSSLKTALP